MEHKFCISYCMNVVAWFGAASIGISRVLLKVLKYFNGTAILTSFIPLAPVWPDSFVLNLNESVILSKKLTTLPWLFKAGSSVQYLHKLPDVLGGCHCIVLY